jgi:ribosomal-protein-alanine N-acetyltransferase
VAPRNNPPGAVQVGDRVYLRRPRARDRDEFLELTRSSGGLHRSWVTPPVTPGQFEEFMQRARRADVDASLVCRLEDRAIVGVFILSQIFRRGFQNVYLGFYAGAAHARRGYMREGMQLLLRHVFRTLKLHRVEANVQPQNTRSIALIRRSGFLREGFSPRYLKVAGRWRDHQRWAMTAEDWRRRLRSARRQP